MIFGFTLLGLVESHAVFACYPLLIAALSGPVLGLVVIAIASGATVLSHVNDSGFWLVSRYFGLTEKETLKSWTVMETLIGVIGVCMALLIGLFI